MCCHARQFRHEMSHDVRVSEVREFEGLNASLLVAKLKLISIDQVFERPAWPGEELSHDPEGLNAELGQTHYSTWSTCELIPDT